MSEDITNAVIGCAIEVHKRLGPGLLERVYQECLGIEFIEKSIEFEAEKQVTIRYRDNEIESAFRIDFLVENACIVELKAVECILPVHEAQILTYMKLTGIKYGLLLNFNVPLLKDGVKRFVY
jgi:GxxExxY protein